MKESFLYHQIAESIREEIIRGILKPGARMVSVRHMAKKWDCTLGTVQHAYQELTQQGLIVSRPGYGTRVTNEMTSDQATPLRRANLVHMAEAFILEALTSNYSANEIEQAVRMAFDRWRTVEKAPPYTKANSLRFSGSHDLAIAWIASHFSETYPEYSVDINYNGSLGGLIALVEGKADFTGCHLWDQAEDKYNIPFVKKLLPGQKVAIVNLAMRRIGLILPSGNPLNINNLSDLIKPHVRFVNRQAGSGTRVWLDSNLQTAGIGHESINGYDTIKLTHSEVAQAIAKGEANVGIGLESAAMVYNLGFVFLTREQYDLIVPKSFFFSKPFQTLLEWLAQPGIKYSITSLGGYLTPRTGEVEWVN